MNSTNGHRNADGHDSQPAINGVHIYTRPENENVSLYEGRMPPRQSNHMAIAVMLVVGIVLLVGVVYGLAVGLRWMLSSDEPSSDITFEQNYIYVIAVKTFGETDKTAAENLKDELSRSGYTPVAIYPRPSLGKRVVVTIGSFEVGMEKDAAWTKAALLKKYPDAEAKFIKLQKKN